MKHAWLMQCRWWTQQPAAGCIVEGHHHPNVSHKAVFFPVTAVHKQGTWAGQLAVAEAQVVLLARC